jgi:TonB family protein
VVVALAGTVWQWRTNQEERRAIGAVRFEARGLEALRKENQRLERSAAEGAAEREKDRGDAAESGRLRDLATALVERLKARSSNASGGNPAPGAAAAAAEMGTGYDLGDVDQKPTVVSQGARPMFPLELRRAGIGGEAVISFVIGADGEIRDLRGVKATHPDFERAAIDAIRKWKFTSGQKAGLPVNTRMQIPIVFNLAPSGVPAPAWF